MHSEKTWSAVALALTREIIWKLNHEEAEVMWGGKQPAFPEDLGFLYFVFRHHLCWTTQALKLFCKSVW